MSMYVLQIRTGRERDVCRELTRLGYTALLPIETRLERSGGKWHERERVLFPCYLLIETDLTDSIYHKVKGIPNVLHFLNPAKPVPLPEDEAAFIREITAVPLIPSNIELREGGSYEITAGPLVGHEGKIIRLDKHRKRVTLSLTMHGKPHKVTLSANILKTF